jgi:hypothetical protein
MADGIRRGVPFSQAEFARGSKHTIKILNCFFFFGGLFALV